MKSKDELKQLINECDLWGLNCYLAEAEKKLAIILRSKDKSNVSDLIEVLDPISELDMYLKEEAIILNAQIKELKNTIAENEKKVNAINLVLDIYDYIA